MSMRLASGVVLSCALWLQSVPAVATGPEFADVSTEEIVRVVSRADTVDPMPMLAELLRRNRHDPMPDAESLAARAEALAADYPDPALAVDALNHASWVYSRRGDPARGLEVAQRAQTLIQPFGDTALEAHALYMQSLALKYQSENEAAEALGERALRMELARGAPKDAARVHMLLGAIARGISDYSAALEHQLAARDLFAAAGDATGVARASNNVGLVYWSLNQLDEARLRFEEALAHFRVHGPITTTATAINNLGLILIAQGQPRAALTYLEEGLALEGINEMVRTRALMLGNVAYAYEELGDLERAMTEYQRTLRLRRELGNKWGVARTLGAIGGLHNKNGDWDKAETYLDDALVLAVDIDARDEQRSIYSLLASTYEGQGRYAEALAATRRSVALAEELGADGVAERLQELEQARALSENTLQLERQTRRQELLVVVTLFLGLLTVGALLYARSRADLIRQIRGSNEELMRATENLRESEQRYRSLFETSSIPTLLVDIESGSIRDLNAPAAALCGAAPDQLIGNAAWDLEPDWLSRAIGQRTSLTDASLCVHESWVSETGEQSFADIWLTPVSLGGDASSLVTVHDTTEERRFENERIRTGKLESLGVLAGGIAHDFNNALAVVMGYVNLARNAIGEHANATALLTAAEKSIDHCAKLTADLQAFAKGGQPQLELHDMRLRLTEAVRMATAGSDSDIMLNMDDALWNAEVDASQFKQMISSLVLNGLQAMPEGGQLTVTAANVQAQDPVGPAAGPGDYLRFDVTDSGTGIPLEIQANVLDPYFSTRTGSTGLGLTSAFAIATRHGGWLEFTSAEGEGSTFSVWLPALRDAVTSPAALPVFMRRGSERVLVMDDNESVQMMYAAALHKLGYTADIVADGQTAIAHYAQRMGSEAAYDLVVLDLTVPGGMGGKDTMAALLRLDPEVLAIVASGYSADPVMAEYQAHGFSASLQKPFSLDEMSVALRRVLDAGASSSSRAS